MVIFNSYVSYVSLPEGIIRIVASWHWLSHMNNDVIMIYQDAWVTSEKNDDATWWCCNLIVLPGLFEAKMGWWLLLNPRCWADSHTNTKAVPKWTRGAVFRKTHGFSLKVGANVCCFFVGPPPPRKGRVFPVKRHEFHFATQRPLFLLCFLAKVRDVPFRFRSKFQSLGFQLGNPLSLSLLLPCAYVISLYICIAPTKR